MSVSLKRVSLIIAGGLLVAGSVLFAEGTRFSDFAPLARSAGPTADVAVPMTFGNPDFQQRSLADRNSQLAAGFPNTGVWEMNTVNERPSQGRLPLYRVRIRPIGSAAP